MSRNARRLNEARKPWGVSISRSLVARLTSTRTESMPWTDRENCPARTVAMLPDSLMAARMASVLSCQIVQPTAVTEIPSSTKAAHQRCRKGKDCVRVPAAHSGGSAALPHRADATKPDMRSGTKRSQRDYQRLFGNYG